MKLTLKVWRQKNSNSEGKLVAYDLDGISPDSSFLEMLDILNETLIERGEEPVAFDHDCREGICGMCSLVINGIPHGHERQTTVCQLHMRHFKDGQTVTIEPWRSKPLPVIKDLIVDRTALEKIQQAGGFVSISTGGVPDANATPIPKQVADVAMDAAACIGCGACVAACKNASAMLFMSAKVSQLNRLPQGKVEKDRRVLAMVKTHDELGFGNCTNFGECQAVCPKGITLDHIAKLNRDYAVASFKNIFGGVK
ncbi:MAG: succinate dehydrogenase/fumarate reductase iron-sulfur subunit [Opitutales bacterium]|nr:succinate dehydrogenase/fumarate reductase iron-sulfur subunit [Opitutales bacterium]